MEKLYCRLEQRGNGRGRDRSASLAWLQLLVPSLAHSPPFSCNFLSLTMSDREQERGIRILCKNIVRKNLIKKNFIWIWHNFFFQVAFWRSFTNVLIFYFAKILFLLSQILLINISLYFYRTSLSDIKPRNLIILKIGMCKFWSCNLSLEHWKRIYCIIYALSNMMKGEYALFEGQRGDLPIGSFALWTLIIDTSAFMLVLRGTHRMWPCSRMATRAVTPPASRHL